MTKMPDNSEIDESIRAAHERMVDQIAAYRVKDPRVLNAMGKVKRHAFIPGKDDDGDLSSYDDRPLPIGHGQTISQPYIVAHMTELLKVRPGMKILEIGTGSGYQAAVLAEMGAEVFSIEIISALAEHASQALKREGYGSKVHVRHANGHLGWPEHGPYDAIIITCAPPEVPRKLLGQLKESGMMILPVGEFSQKLVLGEKNGNKLVLNDDIAVRFVPMVRG